MKPMSRRMKFTRSSYRRKIIMFGISLFTAASLSATGFAAWLISNDAQADLDSSVEVGTVTDKAISFGEFVYTDGKQDFVFEARQDDTEGRVVYEGDANENLSVTFTVDINNSGVAKNVNLNFVTETGTVTGIPAGVQAAIKAGYINAPSWVTLDGERNITAANLVIKKDGTLTPSESIPKLANGAPVWTYQASTPSGDYREKATLTVTIEFTWGSVFGGMNPGLYYDQGEGLNVSEADLIKTLNTFKAVMHGMTYDEYVIVYKQCIIDGSDIDTVLTEQGKLIGTFNMVLSATAN